jgi:serine/threonine protein kinase
MSRILQVFKDSEKYKTEKAPIKWMAPESLQDLIFSLKSDVWSFGATLLEIWTDWPDPFPNMTLKQVLVKCLTSASFKPEIPPSLPSKIQTVLRKCFENDPDKRPSAGELVDMLKAKKKAKKIA